MGTTPPSDRHPQIDPSTKPPDDLRGLFRWSNSYACSRLGAGDPPCRHLPPPPGPPESRLEHYAALLEADPIACLFVVQVGDSLADLAAVRGRPFADPEFVHRHGGWFEAVFVLSDDGFGHVVFVPDQPDIDPEILKLCRAEL